MEKWIGRITQGRTPCIKLQSRMSHPLKKIKRLERELEDERIRNLFLNEVVDILDSEHGTNLRKKYLAKEREAFKNRKDSV